MFEIPLILLSLTFLTLIIAGLMAIFAKPKYYIVFIPLFIVSMILFGCFIFYYLFHACDIDSMLIEHTAKEIMSLYYADKLECMLYKYDIETLHRMAVLDIQTP